MPTIKSPHKPSGWYVTREAINAIVWLPSNKVANSSLRSRWLSLIVSDYSFCRHRSVKTKTQTKANSATESSNNRLVFARPTWCTTLLANANHLHILITNTASVNTKEAFPDDWYYEAVIYRVNNWNGNFKRDACTWYATPNRFSGIDHYWKVDGYSLIASSLMNNFRICNYRTKLIVKIPSSTRELSTCMIDASLISCEFDIVEFTMEVIKQFFSQNL